MVRAQTDKLGKNRERYPLGKMILDIVGDRPLLPSGEAAPHGSVDAWGHRVQTGEFVRQHDPERLEIVPVVGANALDQLRQLVRRVP